MSFNPDHGVSAALHSPESSLSVPGRDSAQSLNLPRLASEMMDQIIDELASQTAALGYLGLVSKSLLPRTRFHMFRTINLMDENAFKLLELLHSPHSRSHIPARVQRVSVHPRHRHANNDALVPVALEILALLPNVHSLGLHSSLKFPSSSARMCSQVDTLVPNVTRLLLAETFFERWSHFAIFLLAFPRLVDLRLIDVDVTEPTRGEQLPPCTIAHLDRLVVDRNVVPFLMQWVPSSRVPVVFERTDISRFGVEQKHEEYTQLGWMGFLLFLSRKVRHLTMTMNEEDEPVVDVSANTELRSLAVAYGEKTLSQIFDTVNAPHLREITLHVCSGSIIDWKAVVLVLRQERFANVQRIEVTIHPHNKDAAVELVETALNVLKRELGKTVQVVKKGFDQKPHFEGMHN